MSRIDRRTVLLSAVAALSATVHSHIFRQSVAAMQITPTEHIIEIKKFRFKPNTLLIRPNDTITWINRDIVPHTATAKDKNWDTGKIKRDQSVSLKFAKGMEIAYFCRFHPNMKAVLEIKVGE